MDASTDGDRWTQPYPFSSAAAIVFIACFGIGTIVHFAQMVWLRTWYFVPFIIGCIMETFGYYGRFWLSRSPNNFKAYVLYDLLVLPAPIFLAATLYMSLSRILQTLDASEMSPIRPTRMSKMFVAFDVLCFLVQIAGVGMGVTIDAKIQHIGAKVVVVGLVLQIIVFVVFIWVTIILLKRCKAQDGSDTIPWKRYMGVLFAASGCTMIRNIVRGAEHAQGSDGTVASREVFIYVFDALPIFIVVFLFAILHPGKLQRIVRRMNLGPEETVAMVKDDQAEGLVPKFTPIPMAYVRPYKAPEQYLR